MPDSLWKIENVAYTAMIIAKRLNTSNHNVVKPNASVAVYSSAKYVSVKPFWWNAIQKKITTANTRHNAMIRCLVSAGVRLSSTLAAAAPPFLPPSTWRNVERNAK